MLYLVDSSILIDAKRQYYQFYRVPEYWKWLEFHAKDGKIKIPWQIFEEVTIKSKEKDQLDVWVRKNKDILVLDESISEQIFKDVIDKGYAPDLSDSEYEKLGGDPFLIAYALSSKQDRIIVTSETSKSSLKREKRMIPNVCETFGIRCVKQWELIEE
ncbi:MAG: DUF4411 family protein [Ectothiorhodospiraceae bacterium AqS1]|nr:DUF4411 family protein [Ectothiorhodospiraceae bacterium AqS1]